jgi:hypothetical protein
MAIAIGEAQMVNAAVHRAGRVSARLLPPHYFWAERVDNEID